MMPEKSQPVTRCALYIRVSSSEQAMHGKSLEAQRMCLEAHAEKAKAWMFPAESA